MLRCVVSLVSLAALACRGEGAAPAPAGAAGGGAAGAGGSAAGGGGGAGGAAGAAGAAGTAGTAGAGGAAPCSEDPSEIPAGAVCVHAVEGRIVDGQGAPIPDLLTTVCGAVCWAGTSDAGGRFRVEPGAHLLLAEYSVLPHGRPQRAPFYFALPLEQPGPIVEVGDLPLLDLPEGEPIDLDGALAQSLTSGEVTLELAAGIKTRPDPEDLLAGGEGLHFRALRIPDARLAEFGASGFGALYALAPFEARFQTNATPAAPAAARLSFANVLGLPAGSPVEVVALGSLVYPDWVTPAAFEPVATAAVGADATRIDLDAGEAIEYLTWVGLRAK